MNYTSIEQSKKLVELGLKPESVDMCYLQDVVECKGCIPWRYAWYKYPVLIGDKPEEDIPEPISLPCWSVGSLFELIPENILIKGEASYKFEFKKNGGGYGCIYCGPRLVADSIATIGSTPIEAAYNMVVYLLENKYIQ